MSIFHTLLFGLLVFQGFVWLFSQACDKRSSVLHAVLCLQGIFICTLFGVSIVTAFIARAYLWGEEGGCSSEERKPEHFLLQAVQL